MVERKNARPAEGKSGTLVIIGGHENKEQDMIILREVARRVGDRRLVVTTVASHEPEGYFEAYQRAFHKLGVKEVVEMCIQDRGDALRPEKEKLLENAAGIFFTGGDQLKISSQLGDTKVFRRAREIYQAGGVLAGTSAGASVLCETMLVSGPGEESYRIGGIRMAPGLGFISNVIIDQHFAERGRMGRLLGAVAQNPRNLGIGIDEDTAIVVDGERSFFVLGSGAVYVIDGKEVTYSNIVEAKEDRALSMYDVRLHVLSHKDHFDLQARMPSTGSMT